MPSIRPITDLRNNSNEISEFVKKTREPVFITKNGIGDMVVMSMDSYEKLLGKIELYSMLLEAEAEITQGNQGDNFNDFVSKLRDKVHGKVWS